jgi:serine/threonine-protein kinase
MPSTSAQRNPNPVNVSGPPLDHELTQLSARPADARAQEPAREAPADENALHALVRQETVISRQPPIAGPAPGLLETPPRSSPSELGRLLQGTHLGHFRLEQFVGGGGMGAVFRATDTMLGRTVAVKILSRDRTDTEILRRFQNEAQSAARLDHVNIARVYYVGEDQGLHYIVFEYIEGVNLRELVAQKGPLPLEEAIRYLLQVAEALEHASQRDVIHRDIKPSNVLVTADGRAKLVDMGLARLHHLESEGEDLTASGVTLGTFDYISPEQARDPRVADVRSDLYSLGCTFYFMLTGRPPFPNGTMLQKLLSHSSEDPSDPRNVRPDLPAEVLPIIHKLLAKQPAQRYQRPAELIGELLLLADRLNLSSITRGGAVWLAPAAVPMSPVTRSLPWLVPLLLLLVAVFVVQLRWLAGESADLTDKPPLLAPIKELAPAPGTVPGEKPSDPQIEPRAASQPSAAQGSRPDEAPGAPRLAAKSADSSLPAGPGPHVPPEAAAVPGSPQPPVASPTSPPPDVPSPAVAEPAGIGKNAPAEQAEPSPPAATGTGPQPAASTVHRDEKPGEAQPPAVSLIVVAGPDTPVPENAKRLGSLEAACDEAAVLGVPTIELHYTGPREQRPFRIAARRLTIRNGAGFQPTVLFRPDFEESAADRRMIRVEGGDVEWHGIHLHWDLPPTPVAGWGLFHLRNVANLDVDDTVITVRCLPSEGKLVQDRVAVLELEGAHMANRPGTSESSALSLPPHIDLHNCLVRGQATLLRADPVLPFRLVCQQSLLVLRERLVDVAGARVKPHPKQGRLDLVLKNVTAVLGQGLCRLSSDAEAPYQVDLVTDYKDSILHVTGPEAALIERKGVSSLAEVEKRLYIRGRDNFYLGSPTLLRISPNGGSTAHEDFDFDLRTESWYQEESPRFAVVWKAPPPVGRPEDLHMPADYQLDESENNPARVTSDEFPAGVDPARLPMPTDVPVVPQATSAPQLHFPPSPQDNTRRPGHPA